MNRGPMLDERSQASPRLADARPARVGPHLGPIRVTATRVTLTVALVGGLGFLAWAAIVRDQLQVPLMASGFAICGLVFGALAVIGAANVVRAGRDGRDGTAVLSALAGGLFAVAAMMSLAAAVIMGLIWSSSG